MFEKILFPTDFSEVSEKALRYIKELTKTGLKEVVVLHVVEIGILEASHGYLSGKDIEDYQASKLKDASEALKKIGEELSGEGLIVKARVEIGFPLLEILRIEKEENVSMIVLGSHGLSNLQEMFLGSVSEKVIRKCKNPILVIRR